MPRKYWDELVGRKREMIDVAEVTQVDFAVDNTGKMWLNIDDGCAVRIGLCRNVAISAPNFNTTFSFIPPDAISISGEGSFLSGSVSVRFESKELYDAYIERERALFEEWCGSIEVTMLARNPEDDQAYAAPFVQSFWRAWQACATRLNRSDPFAVSFDRQRELREFYSKKEAIDRENQTKESD